MEKNMEKSKLLQEKMGMSQANIQNEENEEFKEIQENYSQINYNATDQLMNMHNFNHK